jgi:hypothetical protein
MQVLSTIPDPKADRNLKRRRHLYLEWTTVVSLPGETFCLMWYKWWEQPYQLLTRIYLNEIRFGEKSKFRYAGINAYPE